jgi:dienelactone hydrolase
MENAAVDYIFVEHGGAVHSFTNPDADNRNMDGVAYDNDADRRSWRHTLTLFNEVFE